MQSKTDIATRKLENSEFPILCEGCLGENPYVRMMSVTHGGKCKMCDRPFTLFQWRPGRGEGYRKTEVCQSCARIKNICQTCILDLQYGLPSQLRDAILANTEDGPKMPESEVGKEYVVQRQLALLDNGLNPWQDTQTPNEMLIEIARSALDDRENKRVKLQKKKRSFEDADETNLEYEEESKNPNDSVEIPLPAGIKDKSMLDQLTQKIKVPGISNQPNTVSSITGILPPKPKGPPPASAFKNKQPNPLKTN